jgi:hypothetical protein
VLRPAATALIVIPDPLGFPEYIAPDLVLTITRTVAPDPPQTILYKEINYNVDLIPGGLPLPIAALYQTLLPVSLYVALPKAHIGLGPGIAFLDIPADGTPPPFEAVRDAMNKVLARDPNAAVDLTTLTVEKCRHIANEIVSNRFLDPLPSPPMPLEELYEPGHDTERQQFEANLLSYSTVHGTRAEVLTKYIYSVSAALACEKLTDTATAIAFTFPIMPGLAPQGGKIAEATVVVTQ